jgi:hypothetical protein
MRQLIRHSVLLIAGYLIANGSLIGQSGDDLRRKYGEPSSETFVVRPGVEVTATYAADRRITELLIAPGTSGALIKSRGNGLSRDSVDTIIDELAPLSLRGKYVIAGFLNVTCLPANDCAGSEVTYEKVTIYYNAAPEGRLYYAVVKWNDKTVARPQ